MDLQNKDLEKKRYYRLSSIVFFVISLLFFAFSFYGSNLPNANFGGLSGMGAAIYFVVSFFSGIVFGCISLAFFLKYKLNKKNIVLKDIAAEAAIGIVIILLIFIWRLLVLTLSKDVLIALQLSITEWVIVGIGIVLIALGVSKKSK